MQDNEKYQVLSTKVSVETYNRLHQICVTKGMTIYELVQMVCDTLIRYMDDAHNLTPEMEQAMSIFEHMNGWHNALNLADPTAIKEVGEAVYFLADPTGEHKGSRAIHIRRPYFGDWEENANIQTILERCINLLMPERYRRLRLLAIDMDCSSIMECLDKLVDEHSKDADLADIRGSFEDANRSDWGTKPKEDGPYVRKLNRNYDLFNQ